MKRGQMVLAVSVVVTVALVPVAAAYLQLGYAPDAGSTSAQSDAVARGLEQSVAAADRDVAGEYNWSDRTQAVDAVRESLRPRVDALRGAFVAETVGVTVTYNETAAARRAATRCPAGPGRAFGRCVADRGVVVQERAGETVLVAVAFDVRVTRPDGTTSTTLHTSA